MCCCVSIYLEKSKQYYDHSFHWNMKSARKSIRLRKGPDAVFVELTAPLEDPEEAFFQPLGKIKVVAMILIKNFIIEHTGVTVIDRKIELPALGLNSAFIITLLLNCCSEDKRDLPWPVQTCIHAPYFRQYSDIDTVLAAQVRFENAKTRHFVAAVSFIAQQRPLLHIGVTLIRHEMRGVWRGGQNGLQAPGSTSAGRPL